MRLLIAISLAALGAGCSSSSSSSGGNAGPADASSTRVFPEAGTLGDYDPTPFGGSRPVKLYVPSKYSPGTPAPLVVMLHGYGASGATEELLMDLKGPAEASTVLYAHPDGTLDMTGKRFWKATNACCDFWGVPVDDETYLTSLVTEIEARYDVDPRRIYFVGHSNGGFMSYRMACDQAGMVAAIASLAGAMSLDATGCKPSDPVSVLEIHGTADQVVLWDGGNTDTDSIWDGGAIDGGGVYPGVTTTVGDWAKLDGCSSTPDTSQPGIDIAAGMQTGVARYTGCRAGTEVDLWTIDGGEHIPGLTLDFGTKVFAFLLAHPKP
jgi:polyhydroxybutyrate depolymerase